MVIEIKIHNRQVGHSTAFHCYRFRIRLFAYSKWGAKSQKEELASNINKAGALSMLIITDYGTTWNASIEHKEVEDEYGNKTYSYDFSSAINARIKYYQNADVLSYLDSLKTVMQIAMRKIDSNSKEDVAFTSAFEKVSKLINMAKEPMGSLFTFNQNTNIMYSDFGSSMDQLAVFQKIAPKDSMERWAVQFCQEKREGLMDNLRKKSAINKTQMQRKDSSLLMVASTINVFLKATQRSIARFQTMLLLDTLEN